MRGRLLIGYERTRVLDGLTAACDPKQKSRIPEAREFNNGFGWRAARASSPSFEYFVEHLEPIRLITSIIGL
jgi:hypothetical protein